MQRLFTTFADGWPGLGLLLQRLLAAIVLLHYDIVFVRASTGFATVVLQIIGAGACALLLLGLWTPLAGTLFALVYVIYRSYRTYRSRSLIRSSRLRGIVLR